MTPLDPRLVEMARPAALLAAGAPGGRSLIGGVSRCKPGEAWPLGSNGEPMWGIAEVDMIVQAHLRGEARQRAVVAVPDAGPYGTRVS